MALRKYIILRLKTVDHILLLKLIHLHKSRTVADCCTKFKLLQFQLYYIFLAHFDTALNFCSTFFSRKKWKRHFFGRLIMKMNINFNKQYRSRLLATCILVWLSIITFSQTKILQQKPLKFEDSFIGKTTEQIAPLGLNTCSSYSIVAVFDSITNSTMDSISISFLVEKESSCDKDKTKILFQQLTTTSNGQLVYQIMDELLVTHQHAIVYEIVELNDGKRLQGEFLIKYKDVSDMFIKKIKAIWSIDVRKMKFIKMAIPKKIKFQNPRACFAFNG